MTENETRFEHLLKPATIQENGKSKEVLVAHAWLEVQTAHLGALIPADKIEARWGVASSDTTLRDFALQVVELEGDTSLLMLSARDGLPRVEKYNVNVVVGQDEDSNDVVEVQERERLIQQQRKSWTSADDIADWVASVAPFGYVEADLLTDEQAQEVTKGND